MDIICLDLETFWGTDYTLRKMTTEAYCRDPRFQALLLGVRDPRGNLTWYPHEEIPAYLASVDWSNTAVVAHHVQFDGFILNHHYNIRPCYWFDTLSMARLQVGNHLSVALDSLARHYGLEGKSVPYDLFKDKRWEQLDASTRRLLGNGCIHDVELTWEIFKRLSDGFPREELDIIDMTMRMFTEPVLRGDVEMLQKIQHDEFSRKNELLIELGVRKQDLQSADKFVALLEAEGVEVEYKDGKNGRIPAIAATDGFMRSLAEDDDPVVAGLAQARLEVRSTIDETRSGRLAGMARRGPLPVYLGYCGAHTTRWSGGDKVNLQNLRRGGEIRKAVCAPAGHLLLVADKSQIECRLLNMVAGQHDVIERFRKHEDPYVGIASQFYGRTITKADKAERGVGKQLELSCGYGAGGPSIVRTAKRGTYGPRVELTEEQGLAARDLYRATHPGVTRLWKEGDAVLRWLAGQASGPLTWGLCQILPGHVVGPNGTAMLYQLEWSVEFNSWMRKTRKGWSRIWGGHLVENLIQYLARIDMSQTLLRIWKATGMRPVTTSHDEAMFVVRDDAMAGRKLDFVLEEFRRPPTWLPDIPLDAEGSLSQRYEK